VERVRGLGPSGHAYVALDGIRRSWGRTTAIMDELQRARRRSTTARFGRDRSFGEAETAGDLLLRGWRSTRWSSMAADDGDGPVDGPRRAARALVAPGCAPTSGRARRAGLMGIPPAGPGRAPPADVRTAAGASGPPRPPHQPRSLSLGLAGRRARGPGRRAPRNSATASVGKPRARRARNLVFGVGNPKRAPRLRRRGGRAPTRDGGRGEPFVGKGGPASSRKMIEAMGYARAGRLYLQHPQSAAPARQTATPSPTRSRSASLFLKGQLAALRPRVIVALGKFRGAVPAGATTRPSRGCAEAFARTRASSSCRPFTRPTCSAIPRRRRKAWGRPQRPSTRP